MEIIDVMMSYSLHYKKLLHVVSKLGKVAGYKVDVQIDGIFVH